MSMALLLPSLSSHVHDGAITSVAVCGKVVATSSRDRTVRVGEKTFETGGSLLCVDCTQTAVAAGGIENRVYVWDLATGAMTTTLEGHTGWVRAVKFFDGGSLASGSNDCTAKVWSLGSLSEAAAAAAEEKKKTPRLELTKHVEAVLCVTVVALGSHRFYATGSEDSTVRLFDDEAKLKRVLRGHAKAVVSVADAGPLLVSGSDDKTVRVWDIASKKCIFDFPCSTHVTSLAVSPHRTLLCAAGEVWSLIEQKRLLKLPVAVAKNAKASAFLTVDEEHLLAVDETHAGRVTPGDLALVVAVNAGDQKDSSHRPQLWGLPGYREDIIPALPPDYKDDGVWTDDSMVLPDPIP